MKVTLRAAGCDAEVVGATPVLERGRGHEIQAWLTEHSHEGAFVILDDDFNLEPLANKHVSTSRLHGLSREDVEAALVHLGSNR